MVEGGYGLQTIVLLASQGSYQAFNLGLEVFGGGLGTSGDRHGQSHQENCWSKLAEHGFLVESWRPFPQSAARTAVPMKGTERLPKVERELRQTALVFTHRYEGCRSKHSRLPTLRPTQARRAVGPGFFKFWNEEARRL